MREDQGGREGGREGGERDTDMPQACIPISQGGREGESEREGGRKQGRKRQGPALSLKKKVKDLP